ncbi:MAG: cohesin domain-containing protein, partial [Patescibacteria group bacterium]|nr:cohesin domain-containing protein [Patescibacteria group bacterium]
IFVVTVVLSGIWLYLQKEQLPVRNGCNNNLDCPMQMKCENNVCVSVGCVEEGEIIPGAISPEYRERMATECCAELKGIDYFRNYDANCNPTPLMGGPAGVCSDCGNGICEGWENKCNCSKDCVEEIDICKNFCGDEICQSESYKGGVCIEEESCPCVETAVSCPKDCEEQETKNYDNLYLDIQQKDNQTEILINVNNTPNEVDAFGFDVEYRGDIKFLDYSRGILTNDFDFFSVNDLGNGVLRVGGFTTQGIIAKNSSGNIVILEFEGKINVANIINPVDDVIDWIK